MVRQVLADITTKSDLLLPWRTSLMRRLTIVATALVFGAVLGFFCQRSQAQTTSTGAFGSRTVGAAGGTTSRAGGATSRSGSNGTNIGQGTGSSMMQQATGSVDTSARYIRNNRTAQDFVGANNGDSSRAVGVLESGGNS